MAPSSAKYEHKNTFAALAEDREEEQGNVRLSSLTLPPDGRMIAGCFAPCEPCNSISVSGARWLVPPDEGSHAETPSQVSSAGASSKKGTSSKKERRRARKWKSVDWRTGQAPFTGAVFSQGRSTPGVMEVRRPDKHKPGRRLVEAVIDSGAEASVADPEHLPGEMRPSLMSKAGKSYIAANGTEIPNLGETDVAFMTDEGFSCGIPIQCAKVAKPLIAASQLAEAGNEIRLSKTWGKIVNLTTKKEIHLVRRGGVYILRMWVRDDVSRPGPAEAGFTRQGK